MKKDIHRMCKIFIVLLMIIVFIVPVNAEENIIKVGYYPLENYHSLKDGSVRGYEVDYLNKLVEITGWKIEYVEVKSWNDGIDKLRNNEIDIISPAQITDDRLSEFDFSALPLGRVSGAVITKKDSLIMFEDFEMFSQMVFGVEKSVTYKDLFHSYALQNHFDDHIKLYDNHDELVKALNNNEVDGIIANVMRFDDNSMKLIGRFSMSSYYFMLNNQNKKLLRQLNDAMIQLQNRYPQLLEDLLETYYPAFKVDPISKKEKEYIKQIDSLKIGCVPYPDPLLYKEDNEMKGITIDILNNVSKYIGIPFEYIELPRGDISYDYLINENIDLISSVEYNSTNAQLSHIKLTNPYIEAEKLFVSKNGKRFDPDSEMSVGICTGSETVEKVIQNKYPHFHIKHYNDVESCLDELLDDHVDLVLQNEYSLKRILNKPKYEELFIIAKAGIGDAHSLSPVIKNEESYLNDPLLISILNKGIESIHKNELEMIIIDKTIDRTYQYTFSDIIYVYRHIFIVIMVLLVIIVGTMIYNLKVRKKNILLLQNKEKSLLNERDRLEEMAHKDLLTGVLNKITFTDRCEDYFKNYPDKYCGLVFIDLDDFKLINDTYGHLDGDWLLIHISLKIEKVFGK
ncbi:transporter substrate-binding domain-containing diguanylate cyclase, partial [Candidatus Stoquefichus massiliensis]|uniref:transporter substrate-binding domain-containing diguanylate cyclase n=1 Tax=Candidatus Stoquefichus massiliensis TaxID=1470350 RepID=UPI0005C958D5